MRDNASEEHHYIKRTQKNESVSVCVFSHSRWCLLGAGEAAAVPCNARCVPSGPRTLSAKQTQMEHYMKKGQSSIKSHLKASDRWGRDTNTDMKKFFFFSLMEK